MTPSARLSAALAGVVVGAAGVSAALAAMYLAMREVMVDTGGFCASGGPYQVAPGHSCDGTRAWVLTVALLAGLVAVAVLVVASNVWSDDRASGVGAIVWGALFATLGWNFLDLGIHPPASMSGAGAWIVCAVVFGVMAAGGLVYGVFAIRDYFRPAASEPSPVPLVPLVRAIAATPPAASAEQPGMRLLAAANAAISDDRPAGNAWVWLVTVLASSALGVLAVSVLW